MTLNNTWKRMSIQCSSWNRSVIWEICKAFSTIQANAFWISLSFWMLFKGPPTYIAANKWLRYKWSRIMSASLEIIWHTKCNLVRFAIDSLSKAGSPEGLSDYEPVPKNEVKPKMECLWYWKFSMSIATLFCQGWTWVCSFFTRS